LQGHRQRGIWILRDGKIAVWETAFNVARADQARRRRERALGNDEDGTTQGARRTR
jgi:hypothetical protein